MPIIMGHVNPGNAMMMMGQYLLRAQENGARQLAERGMASSHYLLADPASSSRSISPLQELQREIDEWLKEI